MDRKRFALFNGGSNWERGYGKTGVFTTKSAASSAFSRYTGVKLKDQSEIQALEITVVPVTWVEYYQNKIKKLNEELQEWRDFKNGR